MSADALRKVRVLVNPRSGTWWSFGGLRRAFDKHWDIPGTDLSYQFCQSAEDGAAKAARAVADNVDCVLVVGGDGTASTVGRALVGSRVAMGIIPAGSGNGFARHFGIPLSLDKAVEALAGARVVPIDVGYICGVPFLVTCSMAWEAAVARSFASSRVRGILPYVFAGVQEFFDYKPQDLSVTIDGKDTIIFRSPLIFTIANLSQYGGGARIAPSAGADDGYLELVVAARQDTARLVANLKRFFDGSIHMIPEVSTYRFRELDVRRESAAPIQVDGELVDAPARVQVRVEPSKLCVLVPDATRARAAADIV